MEDLSFCYQKAGQKQNKNTRKTPLSYILVCFFLCSATFLQYLCISTSVWIRKLLLKWMSLLSPLNQVSVDSARQFQNVWTGLFPDATNLKDVLQEYTCDAEIKSPQDQPTPK